MAEAPAIDPQSLKTGEQLDQQLAAMQEQVNEVAIRLTEARAEVAALKVEVVALKSAAPPTSEAIQAAVRAEVDEQMKLLILEKLTLTDEQKLKLDEILRPAGEDAVA